MKKTVRNILLASTLLVSAQADFLMSLTDENGVEESLCVKSYTYSNNLESLHKKSEQTKDIYSETETLTNKIYLGKPVYRKIVTLPTLTPSYSWVTVNYINAPTDVDTFISGHFVGDDFKGLTQEANGEFKTRYGLSATQMSYAIGSSRVSQISNRKVIIEYTKTTDSAVVENEELTTLVHYLPSNSTTGEYVTKSTKNLKIGFFENYTYVSATDSCTKN